MIDYVRYIAEFMETEDLPLAWAHAVRWAIVGVHNQKKSSRMRRTLRGRLRRLTKLGVKMGWIPKGYPRAGYQGEVERLACETIIKSIMMQEQKS